MTTETFGGGHGAPSTVAFYAPGQARNVLGEFDKEDGSGEQTDWEKAKGMTPEQWAKLSDGQKAALLAAVYVADADKKPGASAALAKLRGWVAAKGKGKGGKGGSGGGSGKKAGKTDAQKKSEAAKKKAEADKKRAASALKARRVRPDAVNSAHRDGYIIGESQDGSSRMRWDKAHETYVVEKKDGKGWKEARRLKAEQAYNELAKSNAAWYRPKVQPYLKPEAKKSTKKTTTKTSPTSNGPAINEGVVTRRPTPRAQTTRRPTPSIRKKKALTAASEVHTGAMIALIPREDIVASLAVDGGESADQLHMTEIYLGDAADFDDEDRAYVVDVVSDFANGYDVVDGDAFSVNMFNPPGNTQEDGKQRDACVVLGISGDEVADFHDELRGFLEDSEIDFPEQHRPRIPHVTLVYTDDADLSHFTDRTGPITFDTIRVAFGEDVYDIPLGEGDDDLTAGGAANFKFDPRQPRDGEGMDEIFGLDESGVPIVPNVLIDLAAVTKAFNKERDVNSGPGPGHNLRNYWVKGEGAAKIGWKTPGDWTRCVANLSKYVKDPKGLCSEYHHQATGMWPGDKRNPGMDAQDVVTFDFDKNQPRDGDGQWTDVPGGGAVKDAVKKLAKPTDSASLWKNRKDYVGKVVATRSNKDGIIQRLVMIEGPKGPIIRTESQMYAHDENRKLVPTGKWSGEDDGYGDIKSAKKLREEIEDASAWAKFDLIEPEEAHPDGSPYDKPKPTAPAYVEPEGPETTEPGYSPDEWVNLSDSDAPDGWAEGGSDPEVMPKERRATKQWSELQRNALYGYTVDATTYNTTFRDSKGKKAAKDEMDSNGLMIREATDAIDSAMYPLPRDMSVFRQTNLKAFGLSSLEELKSLEGQAFKDFGYLSTSVNMKQNLPGPLSDVQVKINVPKGKKAAYVADVSAYPEQNELMLARGTKLTVQSVEFKDGRAFVTMKVV